MDRAGRDPGTFGAGVPAGGGGAVGETRRANWLWSGTGAWSSSSVEVAGARLPYVTVRLMPSRYVAAGCRIRPGSEPNDAAASAWTHGTSENMTARSPLRSRNGPMHRESLEAVAFPN